MRIVSLRKAAAPVTLSGPVLLVAVATICLLASSAFAAPKAPFPFRSYDGSWNNVKNKAWGSSGTALVRKAAPRYKDKKSKPSNPKGANPRAISNALSQQAYPAPNTRYLTDMFWQWGQFLDHDIDLTPGAEPAESFDI